MLSIFMANRLHCNMVAVDKSFEFETYRNMSSFEQAKLGCHIQLYFANEDMFKINILKYACSFVFIRQFVFLGRE